MPALRSDRHAPRSSSSTPRASRTELVAAAVKYPGENLTPEEAIERAQGGRHETSKNSLRLRLPAGHVPDPGGGVRAARRERLHAASVRVPRRAALPAAGDRQEVLARRVATRRRRSSSRSTAAASTCRCWNWPRSATAFPRATTSSRSRNRYQRPDRPVDWFTNFGACRMAGGLNLLAKLLGKPGKMEVTGEQVYPMYLEGKLQEINDYCLCDTLDTYFVFLRTRILTGDINPEQEEELRAKAKELLESKTEEFPVLEQYLDGVEWVREGVVRDYARQNRTSSCRRNAHTPRAAAQLCAAFLRCPVARRAAASTTLPTSCTGASSVTASLYQNSGQPADARLAEVLHVARRHVRRRRSRRSLGSTTRPWWTTSTSPANTTARVRPTCVERSMSSTPNRYRSSHRPPRRTPRAAGTPPAPSALPPAARRPGRTSRGGSRLYAARNSPVQRRRLTRCSSAASVGRRR